MDSARDRSDHRGGLPGCAPAEFASDRAGFDPRGGSRGGRAGRFGGAFTARRPSKAARGDGGAAARERLDRVLTCCCDGPTVDLVCGSGRLADRLVRRGVAALSVDISPLAVAVTRSRGVPTLYRDIFDRLPGTGRWEYAILADGAVGLGGDPVRVLRRTRELLARDGVAIVEFAPPETGLTTDSAGPTNEACGRRARAGDDRMSPSAAAGIASRMRPSRAPYPPMTAASATWPRVGIDRAASLAAVADLRILTTATVAGHEIAWLTPS